VGICKSHATMNQKVSVVRAHLFRTNPRFSDVVNRMKNETECYRRCINMFRGFSTPSTKEKLQSHLEEARGLLMGDYKTMFISTFKELFPDTNDFEMTNAFEWNVQRPSFKRLVCPGEKVPPNTARMKLNVKGQRGQDSQNLIGQRMFGGGCGWFNGMGPWKNEDFAPIAGEDDISEDGGGGDDDENGADIGNDGNMETLEVCQDQDTEGEDTGRLCDFERTTFQSVGEDGCLVPSAPNVRWSVKFDDRDEVPFKTADLSSVRSIMTAGEFRGLNLNDCDLSGRANGGDLSGDLSDADRHAVTMSIMARMRAMKRRLSMSSRRFSSFDSMQKKRKDRSVSGKRVKALKERFRRSTDRDASRSGSKRRRVATSGNGDSTTTVKGAKVKPTKKGGCDFGGTGKDNLSSNKKRKHVDNNMASEMGCPGEEEGDEEEEEEDKVDCGEEEGDDDNLSTTAESRRRVEKQRMKRRRAAAMKKILEESVTYRGFNLSSSDCLPPRPASSQCTRTTFTGASQPNSKRGVHGSGGDTTTRKKCNISSTKQLDAKRTNFQEKPTSFPGLMF
jgi:hypothetical protein